MITPTAVALPVTSTIPLGAARSHRRHILALGVAALFSMVSVHAASNTWTGNVNLNWDTATANWTSPTVWADGNDAVFSGAGGAITVSPVSAHSLTFTTNGYSFSGGALTLTGSGPTIDMGVGISTSFSIILSGSAGLTKIGQ